MMLPEYTLYTWFLGVQSGSYLVICTLKVTNHPQNFCLILWEKTETKRGLLQTRYCFPALILHIKTTFGKFDSWLSGYFKNWKIITIPQFVL
jgi:hypothetical protein